MNRRKEYRFITVWEDDSEKGIVFGSYASRLEVDLTVAKELVENRLDFVENKNHYVLIDFTNVKSVTKEARDYMSDPNGGLRGILAGAFLSNNAVATLFVNLYFKINKPPIPSKFFTNRTEALNWLRNIKSESN